MKSALLALLFLVTPTAFAANAELAALAAADQAVRMGQPDSSSDEARRIRVMELLATGAVDSPRDKFNAGLILQHTGLEFCNGQLRSSSAENYLLASLLFTEALRGGVDEARYLIAASTDRYLGFTTGKQRYGTNRVIDQDSGEERLVPIDRTVSDAERATYGVPPLAELLVKWPEQTSSANADSP